MTKLCYLRARARGSFPEKRSSNVERMRHCFSAAEMGGVEGPPGFGGFGEVGEAKLNFQRMVRGMTRLKEVGESSRRSVERREVRQGTVGRVHGDVQGSWLDVRTGALAVHQHARGNWRRRVRRRKPQVRKGHHGAQRHPVPHSGERRQVVFQAVAPEVHHCVGTSRRCT